MDLKGHKKFWHKYFLYLDTCLLFITNECIRKAIKIVSTDCLVSGLIYLLL